MPQNNAVLNQVYANVLGKPVLVPDGVPTSLGFLHHGADGGRRFSSVEAAQQALCLPHKTFAPQPEAVVIYEQIYQLYRQVYFALGEQQAAALHLERVLPDLKSIAAQVRSRASMVGMK